MGFDLDSKLVTQINLGKSHIVDISDIELSAIIQSGKYQATKTASDIMGSAIAVIAVPTPLNEDREPD